MREITTVLSLLLLIGCNDSTTPPSELNCSNDHQIVYSDDPETLLKIAEQARYLSDLYLKERSGVELFYERDSKTLFTGWVKEMPKVFLWCDTGLTQTQVDETVQKIQELDKKKKNIKVLAYLKNGRWDKHWTEWYKFPKSKKEEKYFKDGELDGFHTMWYLNGNKQTQTEYQNGKINLETTFYKDGRVESQIGYKNNMFYNAYWGKSGQITFERVGNISKSWYNNGRQATQKKYKNSNGHVLSADVWKPNGEACSVSNLNEGNGIIVYYNEDGTEGGRKTYKKGIQK